MSGTLNIFLDEMFGVSISPAYQQELWNSLSPDRRVRAQQMQRLQFYLDINAEYLVTHYSPAQLVALSCDELARGSAVARDTEAQAQEWARYEEMLQRAPPSIAGHIRCSKCRRSDQLNIHASQRRSADEGMTYTAVCGCGHHWRFNS